MTYIRIKFVICLVTFISFFSILNLLNKERTRLQMGENSFDNAGYQHSDLMLLILVSSAPGNVLKRNAIRETWGKSIDFSFRVVFLFGQASDSYLQQQIEMENGTYGDVVQGDFLDTYRNLTYKTSMALKYASLNHHTIKYVLKVDDDVFVNTPQLMFFIRHDLGPKHATNLLLCMHHKKVPVVRNQNGRFGKYTVSFDEYSDKFYPTYCSGWGVFFTMDTIVKLNDKVAGTPFFYLEDVYTYGMVAAKIPELKRVDIRPYTLYSSNMRNIGKKVFLVGPYNIKEDQVYELWKAVVNRPVQHLDVALN